MYLVALLWAIFNGIKCIIMGIININPIEWSEQVAHKF